MIFMETISVKGLNKESPGKKYLIRLFYDPSIPCRFVLFLDRSQLCFV